MTGRVVVNGIEMAYEAHGSGARPLVLVHGYTGSRRDFAAQLVALAAHGPVITLDLRGHGDSANTGDAASYTLEQLGADLVAFLDAMQIDRCDLLGHSMGGMAVLRAALAAPERIASLILMNTAARPPDGLSRSLIELVGRVAIEAGVERLVTIARARAAGDPDRSAADRRLEAEWGERYWSEWREPNYRAVDPVAYGALGLALVEQGSLLERLDRIRCPTLVLVGASDTGFLAPADELAKGIAGARRVEIPDAAHQPQLENPDAWLEAIREHLTQARANSAFPGS